MKDDFFIAVRRATSLTRTSNITEATRVIQDALAGRPASGAPASTEPDIADTPRVHHAKPFQIDPNAEIIEPDTQQATRAMERHDGLGSDRFRKPLGETLRILREGRAASGAFASMPGIDLPGLAKHGPSPAVPPGAQFLTRSYACAAGIRSYKLYIPASALDQPRGLVVMLHGCKQNPDDFATGTGMNAVAEVHRLLVAYPHQTASDNTSCCWNWFRTADQKRDTGEPSIIAGITAEIMAEFDLDRNRVFVAGLSAGGAMAAVMRETYPDLYGAVGIHSGLAYASASDVMSAFSVMRGDACLISQPKPRYRSKPEVRTIVFHGGADRTVNPSNAERIVAAAIPPEPNSTTQTHTGRSAGKRAYTRKIVTNAQRLPALEYWLVEGAGHAWSGGDAGGSYTDQDGPDATNEMVRFFLEPSNASQENVAAK
ncbi:poly(hydroxyalkanoate) depolymerase family esterase [Rhizobium tibeticum]|uniref:extracellular catalytic domain type 1 short-chain-length polyhydroxyalkanoate depolymerase n=1 Tax=Rhizobium tibeticum TaxID=501024 RepID=UPI002782663F|nr:PHB depolymerase family esterase [Rhizobium tibeticum]MDP9812228.1 poly(hydroxyalkanoate) depolymerase family esterase [Rhizobium tibeticum]